MKNLLKYIHHQWIWSGIIIFGFIGCSTFRWSKYPEVIFNDREPLMSVSYDYGEIEIRIPLYYPRYRPKQIAFQVFANDDTTFPLLSIMHEPIDEVVLFLPHGVLDVEKASNRIRIVPQDSDFWTRYIPFKGVYSGRIDLPIVPVDFKPLLVEGIVTLAQNDIAIPNVNVSVQVFPSILAQTTTDINGYYQLGIPGEFMKSKDIELVAGTNLVFKPVRQNLDYSNTKGLYRNIMIGPPKTHSGPVYLTNKENVHFRESPEIGSKTMFLLDKGETVSVKKMTTGEYYGDIEVILSNGKIQKVDGWVLRDDLSLMEIENIYTGRNKE
tara:strand:+ start:5399 stop:6373 length:975 start_codon:yes stop_codon:yes gene_type:complete